MPRTCDYCRGPAAGAGFLGRPWPNLPAAAYCCFGCLSLGEQVRQEVAGAARPGFKFDGFALRIGIGLLVVSQSVIFSLAVNLEESTSRAAKWVVQGTVLGGTLLVAALLGGPLFRNAAAEFRRGRLTIEALFVLTMFGAMAASLQSFVTGAGPIYFEVVSVLLVVYALGKAVGRARGRPPWPRRGRGPGRSSECRVIDAKGRDRTADVAAVLVGDVIEVRPGETVCVDGVIRSGVGFASEAAVSGEPFAVVRRPGDRVLAGVASYDATFRVEATACGTGRQIDKLLAAVEQARDRPTSLQGQADRLARLFVPLIVGVSLLTFAAWSGLRGWETGLFNAMAVLLVACPCALGLATPIVVWSALGRLAERGVVARTGDTVERLGDVTCVVFDKTGTLTEDQFTLVDVATEAAGDGRARLLGWLSLIEAQSRHPAARPFAELPRPDAGAAVEALRAVPGCGVEASIVAGGTRHEVRVGRPEWVGFAGTAAETPLVGQLRAANGHRVDCTVDGRPAAVAVLTERLRDAVPPTLAACRALKLRVEVLTGDRLERAEALRLPNARGGMTPDDKRRRIEELKAAGEKPLFVGDGINDAAALAAAHVGIALASGTDMANGAASATAYHGDLRAIPWAVALGRAATRTVRRNVLLAATYNLIGVALAAFGVLHPVAAALLMTASSLWVAWSSVRVGVTNDWHDCAEDENDAIDEPFRRTAQAERWTPAARGDGPRPGAGRARVRAGGAAGAVGVRRVRHRRLVPARRHCRRPGVAPLADDPARGRHDVRHGDAGQPRHGPGLVGRQRLRPAARRRLLRVREGSARGGVPAVDVGRDARSGERGDGVARPAAAPGRRLSPDGDVFRRQRRHGRGHGRRRGPGGAGADRLGEGSGDAELRRHDGRHDGGNAGRHGRGTAADPGRDPVADDARLAHANELENRGMERG